MFCEERQNYSTPATIITPMTGDGQQSPASNAPNSHKHKQHAGRQRKRGGTAQSEIYVIIEFPSVEAKEFNRSSGQSSARQSAKDSPSLHHIGPPQKCRVEYGHIYRTHTRRCSVSAREPRSSWHSHPAPGTHFDIDRQSEVEGTPPSRQRNRYRHGSPDVEYYHGM